MSQMIPDPVVARATLRDRVESVLRHLGGETKLTKVETECLDLKEEAGRRDRVGALLPAATTNTAAVEALAGEVRCFANTPGGGAIILGVEDKTHNLLGTALDPEWLRQRINDLTGVAPLVEEKFISGARLLVILIAESAEPV